MRYMLMLYADQDAGMQIPPDQMQKAMDSLFAYQAMLEKADAFVMTSPLALTSDARAIRMSGGTASFDGSTFSNPAGELQVHDGPYADTREQFGGFYIIEARDIDEAVEWAKKCPAAQWGPVEVRAMTPGF